VKTIQTDEGHQVLATAQTTLCIRWAYKKTILGINNNIFFIKISDTKCYKYNITELTNNTKNMHTKKIPWKSEDSIGCYHSPGLSIKNSNCCSVNGPLKSALLKKSHWGFDFLQFVSLSCNSG